MTPPSDTGSPFEAIKILVIGLGNQARVAHVEMLIHLGVLPEHIYAIDTNPDTLLDYGERGFVANIADNAELLESLFPLGFDVVIVSTPPHPREAIIAKLIPYQRRYGFKLVLDKPIIHIPFGDPEAEDGFSKVLDLHHRTSALIQQLIEIGASTIIMSQRRVHEIYGQFYDFIRRQINQGAYISSINIFASDGLDPSPDIVRLIEGSHNFSDIGTHGHSGFLYNDFIANMLCFATPHNYEMISIETRSIAQTFGQRGLDNSTIESRNAPKREYNTYTVYTVTYQNPKTLDRKTLIVNYGLTHEGARGGYTLIENPQSMNQKELRERVSIDRTHSKRAMVISTGGTLEWERSDTITANTESNHNIIIERTNGGIEDREGNIQYGNEQITDLGKVPYSLRLDAFCDVYYNLLLNNASMCWVNSFGFSNLLYTLTLLSNSASLKSHYQGKPADSTIFVQNPLEMANASTLTLKNCGHYYELISDSVTPMPKVLITGTSRGIGLATAQQFLQEGYQVFGSSRSGNSPIFHPNFKPLQLDLSNPESIKRVISQTKDHKFDYLINNAGMVCENKEGPLTHEALQATMQANVFGPIELTEGLLNSLNKGAHIINISSDWGAFNTQEPITPSLPAYKMSKSSLNQYTKLLSKRLEKTQKVSALNPGWTQTDLGGPQAPKTPKQAAKEIYQTATTPNLPTGKFWQKNQTRNW